MISQKSLGKTGHSVENVIWLLMDLELSLKNQLQGYDVISLIILILLQRGRAKSGYKNFCVGKCKTKVLNGFI